MTRRRARPSTGPPIPFDVRSARDRRRLSYVARERISEGEFARRHAHPHDGCAVFTVPRRRSPVRHAPCHRHGTPRRPLKLLKQPRAQDLVQPRILLPLPRDKNP